MLLLAPLETHLPVSDCHADVMFMLGTILRAAPDESGLEKAGDCLQEAHSDHSGLRECQGDSHVLRERVGALWREQGRLLL